MKLTVLLVVLFASLLIVTGAAFAIPCCEDQCFKVTFTSVDNPGNGFTDRWSICYDDIAANVCNFGGILFVAREFHGLSLELLSQGGSDFAAYMKFHGTDNDIFNGRFSDLSNERFLIHGVEEECEQ